MINCAEGTLTPYSPTTENPWNQEKLIHLMRRLKTGIPPNEISIYLSQSPTDIVDDLIDEAINKPIADAPSWASWTLSDYSTNPTRRNEQIASQYIEWGNQLLRDLKNNGLRDRLTFFWQNHFVSQLDVYICPSWLYQYHKVLQQYAIGNFREFVRAMGITPAMLVYLDGVQNTRINPNENYARELYELFTLGVDNGYTQNDIVETARALTGWNGIDVNDFCGEVTFIEGLWDPNSKTIFGQTGNWGYDDVIDILFEQRAVEISTYICRELYSHFVNPLVDESVVNELALLFRSNDFELAPVLRMLFKSAHFFDEAHIGTLIPGHLEFFIMFWNEVGFRDNEGLLTLLAFSTAEYDQRIFNPVDVSGWPGNRNWINSNTLPLRWEGINQIMGYFYTLNNQSINELIDLAKILANGNNNDADYITRAIIQYFLPKGIQFEEEYQEAIKVFKSEIPENYFEDGSWNLDWDYAPAQVYFLINHIANLPEFQLK